MKQVGMKLSLEELLGLFKERDQFRAQSISYAQEAEEIIRELRHQIALQVAHRERTEKAARRRRKS
jgi:hypothetical protein